jgi:hypothetical protein
MERNEEGLVIKEKHHTRSSSNKRLINRDNLTVKEKEKISHSFQFVYDPIYKHIFLVSNSLPVRKPIIRRFDLNGNLLQRIDIFAYNQTEELSANRPKYISTAIEVDNPSILEGHKLLVNVQNIGSLLLHYDDKNVIDTKLIKYSIEDGGKRTSLLKLKYFNNVKLLYDRYIGKVFINKY